MKASVTQPLSIWLSCVYVHKIDPENPGYGTNEFITSQIQCLQEKLKAHLNLFDINVNITIENQNVSITRANDPISNLNIVCESPQEVIEKNLKAYQLVHANVCIFDHYILIQE